MTTTTEPTRAEVEAARKAERLVRLSMEHDVAVEETVSALRALDEARDDLDRAGTDPLSRLCAQGWVEAAQGRLTGAEMAERAAAWVFDRVQYGARHSGSPGWVGPGASAQEVEAVQDGRVIAERAISVCRTPGCWVETEGKWCAEHAERLARIRAEFNGEGKTRSKRAMPSGVIETKTATPEPSEPAPTRITRPKPKPTKPPKPAPMQRAEDGIHCGFGCGRRADTSRASCSSCRKAGHRIESCAVEKCNRARKGESVWCGMHVKSGGRVTLRPCLGQCGRVTGGRSGVCRACARAAKEPCAVVHCDRTGQVGDEMPCARGPA